MQIQSEVHHEVIVSMVSIYIHINNLNINININIKIAPTSFLRQKNTFW